MCLRRKLVLLSWLSVGTCILCTFAAQDSRARNINICVDSEGNTFYTDTVCPKGFSKNSEDSNGQEGEVETSDHDEVKKKVVVWDKHQLTIENIEMSWYPTENSSTKETIFHPQVEFTVNNRGKDTVVHLKFIMSFFDSNGKLFGDTSSYIRNLQPGSSSKKKAMYPTMGYSYDASKDYNDYKKNLITDTKFTVELHARYKGEKARVTSLDFFSKTVK